MVARSVRDAEAIGSSPITPTRVIMNKARYIPEWEGHRESGSINQNQTQN